jgi:hypothetical protein
MESALIAWVIFLFGSFAVTVLTMTYIQFRGIGRYGREGLRKRPLVDTYWHELSVLERTLLWVVAAVKLVIVGPQ